jgi:predicted enzyme related to lactoylglutathione lyase
VIDEEGGMGLSLRIVQIDVPRRDADVVVDFWSAALGATPVDAPGPFTHLADARSVVEVRVQAIDSEMPRYHLDLEAGDRDAEVARLVAAGAWELDRFDDEGFTVLADPAGLPLCVIDEGSAAPKPLAPRDPDHAYLTGVFVDVPDRLVEAEVSFWSHVLDVDVEVTERPETYTALSGVEGPGGPVLFEVQQVGATTPPRLHVDLEAADVAAEAARLESLGATRVTEVDSWIVLADPVGHLLCVVPANDDPAP